LQHLYGAGESGAFGDLGGAQNAFGVVAVAVAALSWLGQAGS
jgi:hypothetical protein